MGAAAPSPFEPLLPGISSLPKLGGPRRFPRKNYLTCLYLRPSLLV